jgi:hypothetical protein
VELPAAMAVVGSLLKPWVDRLFVFVLSLRALERGEAFEVGLSKWPRGLRFRTNGRPSQEVFSGHDDVFYRRRSRNRRLVPLKPCPSTWTAGSSRLDDSSGQMI